MAYTWDNRVDFVVRFMYGKYKKTDTGIQFNIKLRLRLKTNCVKTSQGSTVKAYYEGGGQPNVGRFWASSVAFQSYPFGLRFNFVGHINRRAQQSCLSFH